MKKKIRYKNPIKEMVESQGKKYTAAVIADMIALAILMVVGFILKMGILPWMCCIALIAAIIIFGWHFAAEIITPDEEMY